MPQLEPKRTTEVSFQVYISPALATSNSEELKEIPSVSMMIFPRELPLFTRRKISLSRAGWRETRALSSRVNKYEEATNFASVAKLKNTTTTKKQTRNLINEYDSSVSQPWNTDICFWALNRTRNFRAVQEEPIVLSKLLHGECTIWHNGSWYAKIRQHVKKGEALESKGDQLIDKMTDSPKNTAQWLQQ